ncbi:MAG TPA: DUF3460 family protein [Usitatibacter sp.]|nr:DUF3460 family protein [Usitatibacter sp.]
MAYESELTRFMRDFMAKNPQLAELQKKNRATWWDKPQDLEVSEERAESAVPQPGYVYFSHTREEDKPA